MIEITYTHLDKIMYPESGITKGDIIEYYRAIAPVMVPHMHNHPLVMQRFPQGITGESFYQKEMPDYFPAWFSKKYLRHSQGRSKYYCVVQKEADLLYLANQGVITPHLWLSTIAKPHYPDRLIFDLDPSAEQINVAMLHEVAFYLRDLLEEKKLHSYVMTTGSRGYHIMVPLVQNHTFTAVRAFAKKIAQEVVASKPQDCTLEMSKSKRGEKIFIDYLRNGYGQTAVAPYALRARPGAPVATPLEWKELKKTHSQSYTIDTVVKRIKKKGDAWQGVYAHPNNLIIKGR